MAKAGRKSNSKRADREVLKALLKEKGTNLLEVSSDMGFERNYLSSSLYKGKISKYAIQFIKNKYGIAYEDYKYKSVANVEQIEPVQNEEHADVTEPEFGTVDTLKAIEERVSVVTFTNEDKEELKTLIYNAVYNAVKDAWKEM